MAQWRGQRSCWAKGSSRGHRDNGISCAVGQPHVAPPYRRADNARKLEGRPRAEQSCSCGDPSGEEECTGMAAAVSAVWQKARGAARILSTATIVPIGTTCP